MPKRRHDTEIWKEDWFSNLSNDYKLAFLLVKDLCDFIGVWRPNQGDFKNVLGKQIRYQSFLDVVNKDKLRIFVLPNGRWYLVDFIEFQYGKHLNKNLNVHVNIFRYVNRCQIPIYLFDKSLLSSLESIGKQLGYGSLSRPLSRPLSNIPNNKLSTDYTDESISTYNTGITEYSNNTLIEADEEKFNALPLPETIRIEDKIDDQEKLRIDPKKDPPRPKRPEAEKLFKDELVLPWPTDEFREAWDFWKEYKHREHRFQYRSVRSEQQSLTLLEDLSVGDEQYAIQILRYTGAQGYEGFQRPRHIPMPKPKGRFATAAGSDGDDSEAVLFRDSPLADPEAFEKAFAGTDYEKFNLGYYRERLANWSDRKGVRDTMWKTQAINFMLGDVKKQCVVLRDQTINEHGNFNIQQPGGASATNHRVRPGTPESLAASLEIIRKQFGGGK